MDKALNYLGIMRKAGACAVGETDCGAACRAGKAKLLLLAADASDNARSRAKGFVYGRKIPLVILPYTKMELAGKLGRGAVSMIAVNDLGLAVALIKALAENDRTHDETVAVLEEKLEQANKRKAEKQAHERNKKFGKRRTKA
ncbi:MAG: 50S ribosomal protein L7 [Oscillospiraceae bacterium]|nr:50S ribosomal protein L7 [Oscillospiraceae bacterium]